MRNLAIQEVDCVSGGLVVTVEMGPVTVEVTGEDFTAAYDWAVDKATDFFCWWDPHNYFDTRC